MDEDEFAAKPPSRLLELPPEVLQTTMYHMDPATFYISLLSCKTLFQTAKSKRILLRQLSRLPGLRLGLENLSLDELFLRFRRRAAESLCGAAVQANVSTYHSLPSLATAVFSPESSQLAGISAEWGSIISIYKLTEDDVVRKVELHPMENPQRWQVVKMAFSRSSDLAVLCKSRRESHESTLPEGIAPPKLKMHLVIFHRLYAEQKGYFYLDSAKDVREITYFIDEEPVGLAMAMCGTICISWIRRGDPIHHNEVFLYGRNHELMEACAYGTLDTNPPTSTAVGFPDQMQKQQIFFNAQFVSHDTVVNLYAPGNPVHSWFFKAQSRITSLHGPVNTNRTMIDIDKTGSLQEFAIGMPFYGWHREVAKNKSKRDTETCCMSYLAVGIDHSVPSNAFIVYRKEVIEREDCDHHIDLDAGRRAFYWKGIGLLAGWRQSSSSLGTIMAISPTKNRIAAAMWTQVLVWSFEPLLLCQGGRQHYFPVRDYNERKKLGRLRPVRLPSTGVVYSMSWRDESTLYATTDQGLVRWEMDHMCQGWRETISLGSVIWSRVAVW
ncbi:MAG: hypothetical protein Q9167_006264 [Letrouitia subvulpina]